MKSPHFAKWVLAQVPEFKSPIFSSFRQWILQEVRCLTGPCHLDGCCKSIATCPLVTGTSQNSLRNTLEKDFFHRLHAVKLSKSLKTRSEGRCLWDAVNTHLPKSLPSSEAPKFGCRERGHQSVQQLLWLRRIPRLSL